MYNNTHKDSGPAFPIPVAQPFGDGYMAICATTQRDYFACHATDKDIDYMVAICTMNNINVSRSEARYHWADRMLEARQWRGE